MLYDVITNDGYIIAHNVMLGEAKQFLRAYYKGTAVTQLLRVI